VEAYQRYIDLERARPGGPRSTMVNRVGARIMELCVEAGIPLPGRQRPAIEDLKEIARFPPPRPEPGGRQ
jgi:hypothetical protein